MQRLRLSSVKMQQHTVVAFSSCPGVEARTRSSTNMGKVQDGTVWQLPWEVLRITGPAPCGATSLADSLFPLCPPLPVGQWSGGWYLPSFHVPSPVGLPAWCPC